MSGSLWVVAGFGVGFLLAAIPLAPLARTGARALVFAYCMTAGIFVGLFMLVVESVGVA